MGRSCPFIPCLSTNLGRKVWEVMPVAGLLSTIRYVQVNAVRLVFSNLYYYSWLQGLFEKPFLEGTVRFDF